jgi:hypothetical protein
LKSLQIVQAQARIKSVGAGLDRVFSAHRTLGGGHGLEAWVEKAKSRKVVEFVLQIEASFSAAGDRRRAFERLHACCATWRRQLFESKSGQKFLRGQLVVVAAVGPEKLGEFGDLHAGDGIDPLGRAP